MKKEEKLAAIGVLIISLMMFISFIAFGFGIIGAAIWIWQQVL